MRRPTLPSKTANISEMLSHPRAKGFFRGGRSFPAIGSSEPGPQTATWLATRLAWKLGREFRSICRYESAALVRLLVTVLRFASPASSLTLAASRIVTSALHRHGSPISTIEIVARYPGW